MKIPDSKLPTTSMRQYYKAAALSALMPTEVCTSAVPALANATGRDDAWRRELISAVSQSCADIADAMLAEDEAHAKKEAP